MWHGLMLVDRLLQSVLLFAIRTIIQIAFCFNPVVCSDRVFCFHQGFLRLFFITMFRSRSTNLGMVLAAVMFAASISEVRAQEVDGLAVAAAIENALVQAISKAEHSVVSIARVKPSPTFRQNQVIGAFNNRDPFEGLRNDDNPDDPTKPNFIPTDFGSGVVIGVDSVNGMPRGYILTNYHVVKGGERTLPDEGHPAEFQLFVKFSDHRGAWATIYAADPRSDLAVIVVQEHTRLPLDPGPIKISDLKPIALGDGSKLKKGQLVVALGNSYASARDGSASASWGMVSNLFRKPAIPRVQTEKQLETLHDLGDLIQVDTRLPLGTSGGALINFKGQMVGLTTSLAALAGFEKSSGFAVPVDPGMLRTIQSLREGKEVEYGFLGISFGGGFRQIAAIDRGEVPNGIYDYHVLPGGPADVGGLRDEEIIVNINGERVYTPEDLTREINKHGPDARVRLTVWSPNYGGIGSPGERNNTRVREVVLAKWGAYDEEAIIASNYRYPPWRGLVVDYSTARNKYNGDIIAVPLADPQRRGSAFPKGVLVLKLLPPLDANQTDIVEGSRILRVNDTTVSTPQEFLKVVRELKGDVQLHLNNGKVVTVAEPAR